ncbi:MAG: hypothetical protein RLZZ324_333, partial [Candidatus Parcubacteria bacterium]
MTYVSRFLTLFSLLSANVALAQDATAALPDASESVTVTEAPAPADAASTAVTTDVAVPAATTDAAAPVTAAPADADARITALEAALQQERETSRLDFEQLASANSHLRNRVTLLEGRVLEVEHATQYRQFTA